MITLLVYHYPPFCQLVIVTFVQVYTLWFTNHQDDIVRTKHYCDAHHLLCAVDCDITQCYNGLSPLASGADSLEVQ